MPYRVVIPEKSGIQEFVDMAASQLHFKKVRKAPLTESKNLFLENLQEEMTV